MPFTSELKIIQGGMGVGISSWPLASAVSRLGQLGVGSGTGRDTVLIRRLQNGDVGGHIARAIKSFPIPEMAEHFYRKYFRSATDTAVPYKRTTKLSASPPLEAKQLTVVSNFVEVFLAKEGHRGVVGINYLEKIQMATLAGMYGAILAGVDYVLMGAGIPREIPGAIDHLTRNEPADIRLTVQGADRGDDYRSTFDPAEVMGNVKPALTRPKFIAIISSSTLALTLSRKATGVVDGFVVEGPTAGGHNAPPRGELHLNERGEPIYGPRDTVDLDVLKSLGVPFWLAGSFGSPEGMKRALDLGATGIQVGTPFALCRESGLCDELKARLLEECVERNVDVFTDPAASPTGFPFKVARLAGTLSEADVYNERPRQCDLGYLRTPYKKEDASVGYRCPAEPVTAYVAKGGQPEDTQNRKCLCNALLANIGLAQIHEDGYAEHPLVTLGDDVQSVKRFITAGNLSYSASDVIRGLL